jgi:hypothetical protein
MIYWGCEVFMDDSIRKVSCSDCESVVDYSFVLMAFDGRNTALMLIASCPKCRKAGDERSLRKFVNASKRTLAFAMENKLPVVLLR